MREIRFDETWIVEITKTPLGPAPEKVRAAWVGLLLPAIPMYYQDFCQQYGLGLAPLVPGKPVNTPEVDAVNGQVVPGRNGYIVLDGAALDILAERSPEAANWFFQNRPMGGPLIFGPDEGEIVGVFQKPVVFRVNEPKPSNNDLDGWFCPN